MNSEVNERLIQLQSLVGQEFSDSISPFMIWLKPTIVSATYGSLEFSYIIRREMTNPMGTLHGGVTAGIIDDLIGATLYSMNLGAFYTTINNAIDYFATAKEGDTIVAKTSIIKRGNTIINAQCELFLPSKNRLIAKGYSNMLKVSKAQ